MQARVERTGDVNLAGAEIKGRPAMPLDKGAVESIVAGLPAVESHAEWKTFKELAMRTPLAQLGYLVEQGLLNDAAAQHAAAIIGKLGSNDTFAWDIQKNSVSEEIAAWLIENQGWQRAGNTIMREGHSKTDFPAWGPMDPAYTSHHYGLSIAAIRQ